MKSCLATLAMALAANLVLYWIVVTVWDNPEFAAFLTGMGSLVAVLGLCHGYVSAWEGTAHESLEELADAKSLARRAVFGGWLFAGCMFFGLLFVQPAGWTAWIYGVVWGVVGGATFAITFTVISGRLADREG